MTQQDFQSLGQHIGLLCKTHICLVTIPVGTLVGKGLGRLLSWQLAYKF